MAYGLIMRGAAGLFVAIVMGVSTSGCGSLVGSQRDCASAHADYLPMWDCIKKRIAAGQAGMMNNRMGLRYIAVGDALAEQVAVRKITDLQARAALAEEAARGEREFEAGRGVICLPAGAAVVCH